jgi:hypothetical protein
LPGQSQKHQKVRDNPVGRNKINKLSVSCLSFHIQHEDGTSMLHRRRLQSETDCAPSPFLNEIPSHLIEENPPEDTEENEAQAAATFFAQLKSRFR